jgi:uncharacterized membrane protein YagU involved in acid resistance
VKTGEKIVLGAVAGFCATMAMTAAIRRMDDTLPSRERYPLPPREITERVLSGRSNSELPALTVLTHFGFGALAGALYALLPGRWASGALYGIFVWTISYFGWVPAFGILKPAHRHPMRRNLLMVIAHVVWGAGLSVGLRELEAASEDEFGAGRLGDAGE